jgi:hypothetical protein
VLPAGECPGGAGEGVKLAFCFLTRGDLLQPQLWEAFFGTAPADRYSLYCHPKEPGQVTGRLLADRIIVEHLPTLHGHISLVEASLALFEAAFADAENEYFILQSESTVPIVPFSRVWDGLAGAGGRSLIPYWFPEQDTESYARLRSVQNAHLFETPFFKHSQWVVLHRRHVALLLDRAYLSWFEAMFAPDEHYFMNVLAHLKGVPPEEVEAQWTAHVNWQDREVKVYLNAETGEFIRYTSHPKTYEALTAADLAAAAPNWFFRKVSAETDCSLALEQIRAGE